MNRVVITGVGVASPIGIGADALWDGVRAGRSAVRRLTRFDASPLKSQIAAEIDAFDPLDFMDGKAARRHDRFSQLAVAASQMALDDAALPMDRIDRSRSGVYIGSALGGVGHAENEHRALVEDGFAAVNKLIALSVFAGAGASNVSIAFGLRGPALSSANSCASGAVAIGEAYRLLRSGDVEVMLAGAAEAPLSPLCFGAFDLINAMSTRNDAPEQASRPFDRARDGFVMGEGSAVFVLETLEHAVRRGAQVRGEITGYGVTSDAHHMTAPLPDGSEAARAVIAALQQAKVPPEDIDYINAHGSATPLNDSRETLAIKRAFGAAAYRKPISATKAMHGHALGASGAIELAIGLGAMRHGFVPPTKNLKNADPECDLDYVPNDGRPTDIRKFVTQSFGFGGTNAALVVERYRSASNV